MEKVNISLVIDTVRSSDDTNTALLGLKEKFGSSEEEVHFLLNIDLKKLGKCNFNLLIDRLKAYKNLLKGFIS